MGGNFSAVAGSKTNSEETGWTAAKLGIKKEEIGKCSLFVTTSGGPVTCYFSNWTAGGMLLRIDTIDLGVY